MGNTKNAYGGFGCLCDLFCLGFNTGWERAMGKFAELLGIAVRRAGHLIVRVYYPDIKFQGRDLLPKGGPVLVCGNHPNSLVDPILLGITAGRPVRFMAKAPLFKTPLLGSIMSALGMIPTYRGSDDAKQVRRNLESLDSSIQFLIDGDAVGIFPEGKSHDAVQLEMVRSGVARISVQAVEQGAANLIVVPVGLNYAHKERFRSAVSVHVGEPIKVQDWLENSEDEGRKAIRSLTNEVAKRLKSVIVHLKEPEWEPLLEDFVLLMEFDSQDCPMVIRKQIADAMNYFVSKDRPRAEAVAEAIQSHKIEIADFNLTLDSLVLQSQGWSMFVRAVLRIGGGLLGLLPALVGAVFHLVPFFLVRFIASRVTPPGRTAISLYRLLVGMPVYLAWYVACLSLFWWTNWLWPFGAAALLVLPCLGVFALNFWPFVTKGLPNLYAQFLILFKSTTYKSLRENHMLLRRELVDLKTEFIKQS